MCLRQQDNWLTAALNGHVAFSTVRRRAHTAALLSLLPLLLLVLSRRSHTHGHACTRTDTHTHTHCESYRAADDTLQVLFFTLGPGALGKDMGSRPLGDGSKSSGGVDVLSLRRSPYEDGGHVPTHLV